jgi:HlyD family secretion protein
VKTDYERYQRLFDKQLVSASEYEKIRQQYNQAQEEKAAADDALLVVSEGISRSNANASTTLIRSTISGLILDVPVKVGNSVILSNTFNEGTTIACVANMSDLIFRGNIDESEVGRIHSGMPMSITIGALQNLHFSALLEYISPKAVQSNGANQFEIKASVSIVDSVQMRSGYSANAEIVLAQAKDVLCVPESAIEFSGDSTFVHVVQGEGDKKTYQRTQVETGLSDGVKIEIKKGITANDKIRGPQIVE